MPICVCSPVYYFAAQPRYIIGSVLAEDLSSVHEDVTVKSEKLEE